MWELTAEKTWELIEGIKRQHPRIHFYGQAGGSMLAESLLMALEAVPLEGAHPQEAAQLSANASALMVDLGSEAAFETLSASVEAAARSEKPMVLVLTGVDLSDYRRELAVKMLETGGVQAMLGSPREMKALLLERLIPDGTCEDPEETGKILYALSLKYGCFSLCPGSGAVLSDGKKVIGIRNGVPVMQQVAGIRGGIALFVAAFLTREISTEAAAAGALVPYICGEIARRKSKTTAQGGSGSFAVELVDAISLLSRPSLIGRIRTEILLDTEEEEK